MRQQQQQQQQKCAKLSAARRACRRQLPSHSQSRALIYNLTWIEFILLRADDQGRAGWREEGEPSKLILDTGPQTLISLPLSLFLFSCFFCFISLTHRDAMSFSPIESDFLYYVYTLTNKALNDWVKNTPERLV